MVWQTRKLLLSFVGVLYVFGAALPFLRTSAAALLINHLTRAAGAGTFDHQTLWLVVLLVIAEVLPPLINSLQWYFDKVFGYYFQALFVMKVYSKMATLDVANHEDPAMQDVFIKVKENGVWRVQGFMSRQLYILQNIFEIVIAGGVLAYTTWWLFLLLFVGAMPELYVEVKYSKEVWGIWGSSAAKQRRFWALTNHTVQIGHLTELKLFQNIKKFLLIIQELFVSFQNVQLATDRHKLQVKIATQFFSQITVAIAVVWFVHEVLDGSIAIGTFIFLLSTMGSLRQSLSGFFRNLGGQYEDNLFVSDVFQLLDLPGKILLPKDPVALSRDTTPDIIFDHVGFAYPGSATPVLGQIDLHIPAGTKLAIVGLNGAGKTTLIKLLTRFYDPTEGRITIGGYDLRTISLDDWYSMIGALFQEYSTYDSFTLREAIALGDSAAPIDGERVHDAAKNSEADGFISVLSKGYESVLGNEFENGIEPSIGQKQKLAIARVFYRNPRIWIFDEPTASVDAEAESRIFEKLAELPRDRTVILISHRFSTVRHADKIVVLGDGMIKEIGTHDELLALDGEYARLFRLQAKGYQ